MNHTMKENTVNPLEGVEFRPIEKKMIEAWTYFIRNNPTAKYKIGDMKEYQENNYMISCEITIHGETRESFSAISSHVPTAGDIEEAQHWAIIKCIAMFPEEIKEENKDIPF